MSISSGTPAAMSLELRVTSPGKPETGSGTIRGGPEMGLPRSPRS